MWHYFDQAKHPTDLVNFWGRSESVGDTSGIWQLEQDLKSVIIPKIDFAQKPLKECLHFVIDELNKGKKSSGRIKCQFMASETNLEDEISLRLSNVPVAEAFRYVTSMAKAKYVVEGGVLSKFGRLRVTQIRRWKPSFTVDSIFSQHILAKVLSLL